jgi:hypothetical protein
MSEISREELIAFTEANTKSAISLDKIAGSLETIVEKQDKLSDSLASAVVIGVNDHYDIVHKETMNSMSRIETECKDLKLSITTTIPIIVDEKIKNSSISKDIEHVKWLVGIVGIVIIVCAVILRLAGNSNNEKSIDTQNKFIQHMITEHESKTLKDIQKIRGE